jgi:hypothetical protein
MTTAIGAVNSATTIPTSSDLGTSGTKIPLLDGANSWSAAQTFINSSGVKLLDTDASHTLGLIGGSNLSANRTLTITTGDANRAITLSGDTTLSGTNTGDQTISDATISTTDITTNDVTSTKHGFAPKSPADALKYLNGAATPAFAYPLWDFVAKLSGDFTVTNGTLTDVTGFSFAANNGETWEVEIHAATSASNTTGDIAVALATAGTWVAGSSNFDAIAYNGSAALTNTAPTAFASGTLSTASPGLTVNDGDAAIRPLFARYRFTMSGTGTVKLQMGQVSASGGRTSTIKANSYMFARRIA